MLIRLLLCLLLLVNPVCADVMTPKGDIRPHHGGPEFQDSRMVVSFQENSIVLTTHTSYPLGIVKYNIADVKIQVNNDTYAFKMTGDVGALLKNPRWGTSERFKKIGEGCRDVKGDYVDVGAMGGTKVGQGSLAIGTPTRAAIPAGPFRGKMITVTWPMAWCANNVVTQTFYVPKWEPGPPPPAVPIPDYRNNNPVVPYYQPCPQNWGGFYPGGWTGPWDTIVPPCPPVPPVPIPGGLGLFGGGLFSLFIWRSLC